jgi:hypothetical protein
MIAGASVGTVGKVSLLALYCVVYTLPLIGITVTCAVMGATRRGIPAASGRLAVHPLARRRRTLAAIIGIGLAAYGIVRLGST